MQNEIGQLIGTDKQNHLVCFKTNCVFLNFHYKFPKMLKGDVVVKSHNFVRYKKNILVLTVCVSWLGLREQAKSGWLFILKSSPDRSALIGPI